MDTKYRVRQTDLAEHAYELIKELILTNRLASGQKLNQEKLAEELGVSRTPLLSAFHKLEKEMLVDLVPRRGAFVKKLSDKEFEDLYDVRLSLEPLGARQAARFAVQEDVLELTARLHDFREAVEKGAASLIRAEDYRFHMTVMRMSGNDLLYRMISSFSIIIMSNLEGLNKEPRQSLEEHVRLTDAISGHADAEAERIMYDHILGAKEHLMMKHAVRG